jgi:hypothetical protein
MVVSIMEKNQKGECKYESQAGVTCCNINFGVKEKLPLCDNI